MDLQGLKDLFERIKQREALDAVNKKALKKDFDDRGDKDIDNDGDVDKSDEYLHNKRKAVTKAVSKEASDDKGDDVNINISVDDDDDESKASKKMKKKKENGDASASGNNDNEVEMNPKVNDTKKTEGTKVSKIKETLLATLGMSEAKQPNDSGTAPESADNNLKGAGAKKAKSDLEDGAEVRDDDEKGHDDVAKAGRAGPSKKPRPNDNQQGDMKPVKNEELSPVASMKKLTDAFRMVLDKKED